MQPNKNKIIREAKSTLLIILSEMRSQSAIGRYSVFQAKLKILHFCILTSLAAR